LLSPYEQIARHGYQRTDRVRVNNAFADFELRPYRERLREIWKKFGVRSVLDYGCGASDWGQLGFDPSSNASAKVYFGLSEVYRY